MTRSGVRVRRLLARPDFRRLFGTRLLSQFGDGVFQAALAGSVLFHPQRAAEPVDVAVGFAVLLLPYSLVGPFAGVWLDRWSRRQVLLTANVVRAGLVAVVAALIKADVEGVGFYAAALMVFAVNRFILAALSAALPHATDEPALVSANALSTTSGTVATVSGGGAAVALLTLTGSTGSAGYAAVALGSALPYLAASAVVAGFPHRYLGPDSATRSAPLSARDVGVGMVAGARHVRARPPAAAALAVMSAHRFGYGVLTLVTLLLYRNTVEPWGRFFPAGLAGLGQVLTAGAVGTLLAAVVTPRAVRWAGRRWWVAALLAGGGLVQVGLSLPLLPPTLVTAGFVLGFVSQGVKICVDTTLQESVDDDFRGRVFSVYDTLFNVTFVLALLLGAVVLPASGVSYPVLAAVAAGYLLSGLLYGTARWLERTRSDAAA